MFLPCSNHDYSAHVSIDRMMLVLRLLFIFFSLNNNFVLDVARQCEYVSSMQLVEFFLYAVIRCINMYLLSSVMTSRSAASYHKTLDTFLLSLITCSYYDLSEEMEFDIFFSLLSSVQGNAEEGSQRKRLRS